MSPTFRPIRAAVPAVQLEHRDAGAAGGNDRLRQRLGVGGDARHRPVAGDEDHVERDIGVLHPEGDRRFAVELEQHAAVGRHEAAAHQALLARRLVGGDLDLERVNAARRGDGQRIELVGARAVRRRTASANKASATASGAPRAADARAFAQSPRAPIDRHAADPSRGAPRLNARSGIRAAFERAHLGGQQALGPGPKRASMVSPGCGSAKP